MRTAISTLLDIVGLVCLIVAAGLVFGLAGTLVATGVVALLTGWAVDW